MRREKWQQVEHYRQMVEAATDYVLMAFGRHMRERAIDRGLPGRSAGFACGGLSSFEDLENSSEAIVGAGAAAIIYSDVIPEQRQALVTIYVGGPCIPTDEEFLIAVGAFERKAQGRGLL